METSQLLLREALLTDETGHAFVERFAEKQRLLLAHDSAHGGRHQANGLFADRPYNPNINVGVLCPPENLVSRASSNSRMLKKVADLATAQTVSIFGKPSP